MTNVLRFSFDIGTNSIGWAVFDAHTEAASLPLSAQSSVSLKSLGAAGVRIFSDGRNPKDGSSLAMMRREPRAARRRRDRFLQRQRKLIALLIEYGLFPSAQGERKRLEKLNPYALRAKGLDHALTLYEFGRVLFHLNQRRGFWSNRVTDGANKETGVLKQAANRLDETLKLDGARTLGEFLNKREVKGLSTRFRITGSGKDAGHEFYPARGLIDAEFQTLWAMQSQYHPDRLTKTAKDAIHNAIFHQRPLKAVKPGRCTLNPDEERLPAALPSVQARTIYQTLNELRYGQGLSLTQRLDRTQRDALASALLKGKTLTFSSIRRTLKLPANTRFSLEDSRKDIVGCRTAKRLARADAFDKKWHSFSLDRKDKIVRRLLTEVDEETLVAWLVAETGLSDEKAHAVAGATLPDGYGRLGATANAAVLEELIGDVITYSAAVERTGYHHSDFRTDKTLDRLPYYGLALERHVAFGTGEPNDSDEKRYGRIANPTVHIGLNQLRRLVNRLIAVHGRPDDIILELARDLKLSKKQKDELQKKISRDEEANTIRRSKLAELNLPATGSNLALWEEQRDGLNTFCPYSGEHISLAQLFSDDVEVEHILPYSRTLDDTMANKAVCMRHANRDKGNRSPFEAFGSRPEWPAIAALAEKLPPNKRWRFAPGAMEKLQTEGRDFLDRQLNETQYLSRIAKTYLETICSNTWVSNGRMTALLRGKWGLNSILAGDNRKNRDDHRHHSIDAVVIGCMSRGLLQEIAYRAGQLEASNDPRIVADIPEPFSGFRDRVRDVMRTMIVSHKPEHGKTGALHEETAYGIVHNVHELTIGNVVHRKPLAGLNANEIDRVRDPVLRIKLQAVRDATGEDTKALSEALLRFADEEAKASTPTSGKSRMPMRHVRLLKPEASNVEIANRHTGAVYKAIVPAENWCIDIVDFKKPDGTHVWKGFATDIFAVNRKGWRPKWEREEKGGKLVMRLHKGDLIEINDKDGERQIKRVVRLNPAANRIFLIGHNDAGDLQKRHDDPDDPFRWDLASISSMHERNAKLLRVDEIGHTLK